MLGSLRFRLPALFLVGIVVSGVIAAAIALALFQNYAHKQLLVKLRREANGLTELYEKQAIAYNDTGTRTLRFAPAQLERATGDKIFYVGADVSRLRRRRRSCPRSPAPAAPARTAACACPCRCTQSPASRTAR